MSTSSSAEPHRSSQSLTASSQTIVPHSSVPNSLQTVSNDIMIVLNDDDDDMANLANRLLTIYLINDTHTMPYWSTGGTAQHNGSLVKAIGTRPKPCARAKAWVIFIGLVPGVYTQWQLTDDQVKGQSGSVYMGYRTVTQANNAFQYAQSKDWVVSTRDANHPYNQPRPAYRINFAPPTKHKLSGPTALSIGAACLAWFMVYIGSELGVYNNFLQAAMNVVGIPNSLHDSANTQHDVIGMYMRTVARREIGTCEPV